MSEAKFTPGPWRVGVHRETGRICAVVADIFGGSLCVRPEGLAKPLIDDATSDANFRLIAAAPDLLAACEAARTYLLHSERGPIASADLCELIEAAVAKAKGA